MAIDGEPKDGDFVRYIEMLNRQAGNSPGQVLPRERRGAKLSKWSPTTASTSTQPTDLSPSAHTYDTSPAVTQDDDPAPTLAARSGQRHLSLALGIAGAIALWSALHKLLTAVNTGNVDMDNMVPVVFLLICAWMLFKGARGARRKQNKPLAKLPPLTTVHMGRKPRD